MLLNVGGGVVMGVVWLIFLFCFIFECGVVVVGVWCGILKVFVEFGV